MAREQQRRTAKSKEAAARKRAQEDDFDDEDDFEVDDDNFLEDDDGEIGSGDGDALVFDLDEVDERDAEFRPVPPGTYEAIVDDVRWGQSQAGNDMMTFVFKLTEGEHKGRTIYDFAVVRKKDNTIDQRGLAKMKKYVTRITPEVSLSGFRPADYAEDADAVGRSCRVKLRVQTQQGERRNNVTDVLPSRGGDSDSGGFL